MSNFSDSLTQGGQTQLHKFHMISQVFGTTFKISLLLTLFFLIGLIAWSHNWESFAFLGAHYKAVLRDHMSFLPNGFFDSSWVCHQGGQWYEVNDHILAKHPTYIYAAAINQALLITKLLQSFVFFLVAFTGVCSFWVWRGNKRQESKILKGVSIQPPHKVAHLIRKKGTARLKIAGVPMPIKTDTENILITGIPGSGKTNAINTFLEQIRKEGQKALIIDITGGYVSKFYEEDKDIILNPFDERSVNWDLWQECSETYEYLEFAASFVPQEISHDPFWSNASRQLLATGITQLKDQGKKSISELLHLLLSMSFQETQQHLQGTYVASYFDPESEKTANCIRSSMVSTLWSLQYLQESKDGFSIREWAQNKEDNGWLFLSCIPTQRAILKPLFAAWLSIAVKALMALEEDENHRLFFIVDELAALSMVPILSQGLAEVRKYGGCFILGFQSIHQIYSIYTKSEAETILGLLGTKVVFNSANDEAEYLSNAFGKQEVLEQNESISYGAHQMRDGVSLSDNIKIKPIISPIDIMNLNTLEAYLKFPRPFPYTKIKFDISKAKKVASPFEERKKSVTAKINEHNNMLLQNKVVLKDQMKKKIEEEERFKIQHH